MSKIIVQGMAQGIVLKTTSPINFLGAVDKKTGTIRDEKYDIFKKSIKDTILVFPHGIGSSVGAYTIYSLKSNNSIGVTLDFCLTSNGLLRFPNSRYQHRKAYIRVFSAID